MRIDSMNKLPQAIVLGVLIGIMCLTGSCKHLGRQARKPDFPFQVTAETYWRTGKPTWSTRILLPRTEYSPEKLDQLFRWYSHLHPGEGDEILLSVVLPRDGRQDEQSLQRVAFFHRRRDPEKGVVNEFYGYSPDPDERFIRWKTVVIKGVDPDIEEFKKALVTQKEFSKGGVKFRFKVLDFSTRPKAYVYAEQYGYSLERYFPGEDEWEYILDVKTPDLKLVEIEPHVELVNDNVYYAYLGHRYAVSLDEGRNWYEWDARDKVCKARCQAVDVIQSVRMKPNGQGMITLKVPNKPGKLLTFRTNDYGQRWY